MSPRGGHGFFLPLLDLLPANSGDPITRSHCFLLILMAELDFSIILHLLIYYVNKFSAFAFLRAEQYYLLYIFGSLSNF